MPNIDEIRMPMMGDFVAGQFFESVRKNIFGCPALNTISVSAGEKFRLVSFSVNETTGLPVYRLSPLQGYPFDIVVSPIKIYKYFKKIKDESFNIGQKLFSLNSVTSSGYSSDGAEIFIKLNKEEIWTVKSIRNDENGIISALVNESNGDFLTLTGRDLPRYFSVKTLKERNMATMFKSQTCIENSANSSKKFKNLKSAKQFLKGKCASGWIEAKLNGDWIRVLEYDTDLSGSFKRCKNSDHYDYITNYLKF